MDTTSKTIRDYIQNAKNGDQKAFSFLLNHFWSDIYGFQLARTRNENDAEDITIQTFSKAFDKINTYNEDYEFKTWLITISKNIHIDMVRREKANVVNHIFQEETAYDVADDAPTGEDKLITEQNLAKLLRYIKKLKPHYQEVINLRYFQELSYQDIATTLNEPINNIKVKLLRAKRLLAEIIQNKNV
ncbi:RNA polymerase sigma factor [Leptobacterium sp. I13]|uniref:RNA polymerase sigma factor n=1 Tax=Leptobacterium meishanense TaxID=3128904 RepID=UPI0030EE8DE6